jgi:hypothetical protein
MENKNVIVLTGFIGLLAAILVGTGEFLLHFDPQARYSDTSYEFMLAGSDERQSIGHYFAVLGGPLYVVGCWHIYLMLKPAQKTLAFIAFVIGAYGFMIGADWISSRASIGALTHFEQSNHINIDKLIDLYRFRYENLLSIIRVTTLTLSLLFIGLVLTGRSHYQKWQALFNPILLLLLNFLIYFISPDIGKYVMPIALNVAFGIFFILSILQAQKIPIIKD